MTKKNRDNEATEEVNATEPTDEESSEEESSSEKENLEDSKKESEDKVEVEVEPKEIAEDYLEEDKTEVDYKKRYGDSTREYQTLKKKNETLSLAIDNLEKLSQLNPKIVSEIEEAQKLSGDEANTNLPPNSTLVQQQVDEALGPVKKMAQDIQNKERLSKVKTLANFEKKNPKLFSSKITKEEKRGIRQRIGRVANALVETGMDFSEAVDRAYLTVNPRAAIQKGKDEAYLEGLNEEQAGFSSQSSAEGKKPTKPKYSKAELSVGDRMGVGKAMRKDKT